VGNVNEPVLHAGFPGPAFDCHALYFYSCSALAAHQVVVVLFADAAPVAGLAVFASQGVKFARFGQRPHLVVHGGQGDVLALGLKGGVEVLSGAELVGSVQDGGEGTFLPRRPLSTRQARRALGSCRPCHVVQGPGFQWSSQWPPWEARRCVSCT
jgi:hypothetical protein